MNPETAFRLRLFIDGELVDEEWFDITDPGHEAKVAAAGDRHSLMAIESGKPFIVEFYDPGEPEGRQYRRMGTDASAMVEPSAPMPFDEAARQFTRPPRLN